MGADRVIVLDKGRVVQQGPHDKLIREDGIYRRVYELQTQGMDIGGEATA
jgi:ATP-binding cassette subfamily B protein